MSEPKDDPNQKADGPTRPKPASAQKVKGVDDDSRPHGEDGSDPTQATRAQWLRAATKKLSEDADFQQMYDQLVQGQPLTARAAKKFRPPVGNQPLQVTLLVEPADLSQPKESPHGAGAAELADELAKFSERVVDGVMDGLKGTVVALDKAVADLAAAGTLPTVTAAVGEEAHDRDEGKPKPDARDEPEDDEAAKPARKTRWTDLAGVAAAIFAMLGFVLLLIVAAMVYASRPRADGPAPLPDEFALRVADLVAVPKPDPAVAEHLAAIKAALARKGDGPFPPPGLTADDREKLEKLVRELKAAAAGGKPKDVLLVVTHASNMNAADYKDALHDAVIKRPRGKDQPTRVGLALGRGGGQLDLRVPLDAAEPGPKVSFDFQGPDGAAAEEASLLGGKAGKDVKWERPVRRAVLVVSTDCEPVPAKDHRWTDFSDVQVVVLARRPLTAADVDKVARWSDFAATTRGMVQLIAHPGDLKKQNDDLQLALGRLIDLPH